MEPNQAVTISQPRPWSTETILAYLAAHRQFLRAHGVRSIGIFGSYRRGTASIHSDLDFLIELDDPTFDRYMDLKFWLEDSFGHTVDLVLATDIKPRLREVILNEVVYAPGLAPVS